MPELTSPLWTDRYTPNLEDLPQADVRDYFQEAKDSPLNLFVYGPAGAGKTAAVNALMEEVHTDTENDVLRINAADFFDLSKRDLADDPRFGTFIDSKRRRNSSKAALMNHVVKELASYQPVDSTYKTLILENASAMRRDFQQALRRVMERHHETTQFILIARTSGGTIPAIKSRCQPISVQAPSDSEIEAILRNIVTEEDLTITDDALTFIAGYVDGNLREAILSLQLVASQTDEITVEDAFEHIQDVGLEDKARDALMKALGGDLKDARKTVDELLIDEELEGGEALELLVTVAHQELDEEELIMLTEKVGAVDLQLRNGNNARTHLVNFLTDVYTTRNKQMVQAPRPR